MYEIATGLPPYPRTQPGRPLGATLGRKPPRLDKAVHSEGLSDLVAFVLEAKPADRPSMDAVLQHPYILGSEDTYPTESLAELVRVYYRWERSGGQRQSLFINAGAAAAEFPQTLHEDEDWNFSTTANFEKEFSEIPLDSSTTVDKTTPPAFTSITDSSSTQPQVSVKKNLTLPSITIPAQSPKYHFDMGDLDNETQTPTGDLTPVDKLNTEERVKRGENALKGLFNENQAPYKYEVKADFVDQKPATILGPVPSGKLASRRTSDLPLRDESGPSSVSRKELDANQLRSTSYDNIPSIDLAPVGTIKANRMNRFLENMNQEDKSNDTFYYGDRLEDEKRATRDWTFPAAAPKDVLQDPKRATIEWGFPPEMQAGPSKPQLAPERPALKHTVTAPVGDIRHSTAGMIDLDALYDDPLYDSDILRTAPPSDDEAVSRPTLIGGDPKFKPASANDNLSHKSINDDGPSSLLRTALTEDDLAKAARSHSPFTASSDSDWEMDPFMFKDMSEDDKKSEINAYLDEEGVTDVQERTSMQHDLLKARKAVPDILKEDMEEADYEKYKKSGYVNAVGDDKEKYVIFAFSFFFFLPNI